jgi:hypothetical protein
MFFQGIGEDEDIVQIYQHVPFINDFPQDVVHKGLKGGWGVSEPKKHDGWFEESSVCAEGGLPFIAFFDTDVVIPGANVTFGKPFGTLELVYEFSDKGERVSIFDDDSIELTVILSRSEISTFLWDKKERRCHGGF